jgi:RHS repeat-associated protein
MVEQNRSGVYTQIVYAPGGQKFALMNGQTLQKAFAPLPGGGQTVYNSSGLLYYAHTDHLGSTRFASTPSRTMYFDMAYAPFGETYAASGSTDASFTTQRQDTVAGLYDFPAREYSIQGRWPSPDPAGLAAVDPTNPQSWNRYGYVLNDPMAWLDPLGLDPCTINGQFGFCVTSTDGADTPGGDGGGFFGGAFGGGSGTPMHRLLLDLGPDLGGGGGSLLGGLKSAAQCAANNAGSAAGALNISKDNFIGQTFLGNDFSTVSQLITGPDRTSAGLQFATSSPLKLNAFNLAMNAIGSIPVSTGGVAVAANGAGTYYSVGAMTTKLGATVAGKVVAGTLAVFTAVKLGADAVNYSRALASCVLDPSKH